MIPAGPLFHKPKAIISLFITGLALFSFTNFSFNIYLTGRLKKKSGDKLNRVDHVVIFVKGNNQVLDRTITNSKGVFHLSSNDNNAKAFYFYYLLNKDTLLLAKVNHFKSESSDLTFYLQNNSKQ
jgi:hypothetical protein